MRILHTADWQIGMRVDLAGDKASRVREERLESVRRLVSLADRHRVDLVLVAGDVFEDNAVDRVVVRRVGEILGTSPCPVYLIPGNHDPTCPGSVWEHTVWQESPRVHVLTRSEPVELESCVLYPCPLQEKHSMKDPTAWIQTGNRMKPCLGLAHGTVVGLPEDGESFPIARDAAVRSGLDYLALGHWHSQAQYQRADGVCRMAYSGTPEPTKFGERDSGNVLLVEIEERGSVPRISVEKTAGLSWHAWDRTLQIPGDLEAVAEELRGLQDTQSLLVRLRLQGLLYAEDQPVLTAISEMLETRFLLGRLEWEELVPAPQDAAWTDQLPPGPLREAALELARQASETSDPRDRQVATRALLQLFELQRKAVA